MVLDKKRSNNGSFTLHGEDIEEVKSFVYLGSTITTQANCMDEVNKRLCMARSTVQKMTSIWKSRAVTKELKLCIVRYTVSPVATYGSKCWTFSEKVTKKEEALEMWAYCRLLHVSWKILRSHDETKQPEENHHAKNYGRMEKER